MVTAKLDDDEDGRIDDGGSDIPTVRGAGSNCRFCGFQRHFHRKVVSVDVDLRDAWRSGEQEAANRAVDSIAVHWFPPWLSVWVRLTINSCVRLQGIRHLPMADTFPWSER